MQEACRFLFRVVVVSGSPEDRTQRDPRIRRIWATSPRLPCCRFKSRTPRSRTESLPLPKRTCFHLHLYPMLCCFNRRRVCGRRISSLSVGREALESSSAVLQTAARPSQLPAQIGFVVGLPVRCGHEKRLDVCVTPSLHEEVVRFLSECHIRRGYAGALSVFNGLSLWTGAPKRLPSCICSSRLD